MHFMITFQFQQGVINFYLIINNILLPVLIYYILLIYFVFHVQGYFDEIKFVGSPPCFYAGYKAINMEILRLLITTEIHKQFSPPSN